MRERNVGEYLGIFHRRWMDRNDAAEYVGISPRHFDETVRPLLRQVLLGKRIVYDRTEIDSVMESKKLPDFNG